MCIQQGIKISRGWSGGLLIQVVYTDCLYRGYRPFSGKCEDEKEGGEVQRKDTREESPKVQNPRGGCLLGGWARDPAHGPLLRLRHAPGAARALGSLSNFLILRCPISQRAEASCHGHVVIQCQNQDWNPDI